MQDPSKDRVTLSGYGVELAIKSQEYKAKDDTKIEGDAASSDDDDFDDSDVSGFMFATLKSVVALLLFNPLAES